jgi:ATP synthase protein I
MADQDRPTGAGGRPDLSDLQARIDRARGRTEPEGGGPGRSAPPSGMAYAFRLSTELVAGVVVGAGLGWFLDRALGTSPWGLMIFLFVGFGAGTINLLRAAARTGGGRTPPN